MKKTPNKVKRTTTTAKAVSHLYSSKCSSPITCLSVYAINQCWCHVKLQKHKYKFAQFNYPYFKTKHDIVYIYRKIVPQVHVTGPAMHKYEMLFFLFRCKFIYINIFLQETFNVVWVYTEGCWEWPYHKPPMLYDCVYEP